MDLDAALMDLGNYSKLREAVAGDQLEHDGAVDNIGLNGCAILGKIDVAEERSDVLNLPLLGPHRRPSGWEVELQTECAGTSGATGSQQPASVPLLNGKPAEAIGWRQIGRRTRCYENAHSR